jgi:predicted molibdopterin-dependent oxidoreductase YjgC
MFLTETAKLATVILPAASFAEKEGTFTNFEGRVQPVRKAVASPGDSLPDFEIILRLAERMGHKMPYSSPVQVMDEIREMVPSYSGPDAIDRDADESDVELGAKSVFTAMRRLHGGLFPTGFGRFYPVRYNPMAEESCDGYPLTLLVGAALARFGSGTRTARASILKKFSPHSWIDIGPTDAERFGLSNGDMVKVVSPVGEVTTTVTISSGLPAGMVFMPASYPESPVNQLLDMVADTHKMAASVGKCFVRLEKIGEAV